MMERWNAGGARERRVLHVLLAGVLLLAFVLRIAMGVYLGFNAPPDRAACGADTVEFECLAWSTAQGEGYRLGPDAPLTAFRAPGYPLMLAGLYRLFGRRYFVNRIALSLVGTATCWLTYLLARRTGLKRLTAVVAALVVAGLPLQVYFCGHFMSEPLATLLNVGSCLPAMSWLTGRSQGARGWAAMLAVGLCSGVSALVRPVGLLFPAVLGGLLLVGRRVRLDRILGGMLAMALGAAIVLAPWVVRNRAVFGRTVLVATNGGSTFWGANNALVARPGSRWGTWISTNFDGERKQREVLSLPNEADRDQREWSLGMQFLRENPGTIPVLLAGKLLRVLNPFPESANRLFVLGVAAGQAVLLPLSAAGLVLALQGASVRRRLAPVFAHLLALLGTVLVFYGSERFRTPCEPFMAVFAALAVDRAFGWNDRARKRRSPH